MKKLQAIYNVWGACWPLGTLADAGSGIVFDLVYQHMLVARIIKTYLACICDFVDGVMLPCAKHRRVCRSLLMLRDKKLESGGQKYGSIAL